MHKAEINKITADMVGSAKYDKIFLNKSLHTTGVKTGSYLRPDIIGLKHGGGYVLVEVASKSQAGGVALKSLMTNIEFYKKISGVIVEFTKWGY